MATWDQMSEQSYKAAEQLRRLKNYRSCISRAYYAAFSAITNDIRKKTRDFPRGYEHPSHAQVGRFMKRHMTLFSKADRDAMREAVGRLRQAREMANYRHDADLNGEDTRYAMIDARYVLESLRVL